MFPRSLLFKPALLVFALAPWSLAASFALAVHIPPDQSAPGEVNGLTLVSACQMSDHVVLLHLSEGYVQHHHAGEPRTSEVVHLFPLDLKLAMSPSTYSVASSSGNQIPVEGVNRKSKGSDWAWHVDSWQNDHAVNHGPDHVDDDWLYLNLKEPLLDGKAYTISFPKLGVSPASVRLIGGASTSQAIHTNLIGYVPSAPQKYAYLYAWTGDGGSLKLDEFEGKPFTVNSVGTGAVVFRSTIHLRGGSNIVETGQASDTPAGNFSGADVYECDFSQFKSPGRYRIEVPGLGRSQPFVMDADAYRQPFLTSLKGLYYNRSGIELKPPYADQVRPAPHNPELTPGFAGQLVYTKSRFIDWSNWDSDPADLPAIKAGIQGPIDVSGWYQDAGDWDSYFTHLQVGMRLMLAFQMTPSHFANGEGNLPESKDGIPDILNEAAWLPRFCYRLRHVLMKKGYGTGGIGLRICGDFFGGDTGPNDLGQPSWQDTHRKWIASGEDPLSTYGYAGTAAQMALCLQEIGRPDPQGLPWKQEAEEAYHWAKSNTRPGDSAKPDFENYLGFASATLYRLTGQAEYLSDFRDAESKVAADTHLNQAALFGPAEFALNPAAAGADPSLAQRLVKAIFTTADAECDSADKRNLRWGGDWYFPMVVGQQTTPMVQAVEVGYTLAKPSDAGRATRYLGCLYTTADYFLGCNSEEMTWVSGLGPDYPKHLFKLDDWYATTPRTNIGITPYGPTRKTNATGKGPWDSDWANASVYPAIDSWPGAERWFPNQCCPLTNEFTIWQTIAPNVELFGFLSGAAKPHQIAKP